MVDHALLEQVLGLGESARRELCAVIDNSLDGYVSPEIAAITDANPDDNVTLDEFEFEFEREVAGAANGVTFAVNLNADAQSDFYRAQAYYDTEAPLETERFVDEFFTTAPSPPGLRTVERPALPDAHLPRRFLA